MKKTLYSIIFILSTVAFTACNDEAFLTEQPKTIYVMENAFDKTSQVDAALANAYNKFWEMNGYTNPTFSFFGPIEGSCNLLHGEGSDVLDFALMNDANSSFANYWGLLPSNSNFKTLWTSLYQLASYANLVLDGAKLVEWEKVSEFEYAVAQARFFRGWAYLRLGECFGGVPIVDKFDQSLRYDYIRTTREETYKFAIADFEAAISSLPDYPAQDGRIARGAVNHFLAEAYLALGTENQDASNFNKAIDYANAVISKHPLMTSRFGSRANPSDTGSSNGVPNYRPDGNVFYDLFQIGNYDYSDGNTESLLVYEQPTYDNYVVNGGSMLRFGTMIGPQYRFLAWSNEYKAISGEGTIGPWQGDIDGEKYPSKGTCAYLGGGTYGMIMSTDYSDEYVWLDKFADDMRNEQINRCDPVCMDRNSSLYGQIVKKEWLSAPTQHARISAKVCMQDEWGWDLLHSTSFGAPYGVQYGRDWYITRSAETVLLKAEAQLRNGDRSGAAESLNILRRRANASYLYSAADVDLYAIIDERARELSWEEMRWPTLLRMGGHGENEVMHHQMVTSTKYSYDSHEFRGKTPPEWTLFAIPQSVIDLNSDAVLEQNPGW